MSCFHPRLMYSDGAGGWSMTERPPFTHRSVTFRCGSCDGCRADRRSEWGLRGYHEAKAAGITNCAFVTLTYDQPNLPDFASLEPDAVSKFVRRLRKLLAKQAKAAGFDAPKVRYFGCGEYGDQTLRPHYHVNIFGWAFPDRKFDRKSKSGDRLYTSELLTKAWPYGHANFGQVSFKSAMYVAGYVMKSGKDEASMRRRRVILEDGTAIDRAPEFACMSTHPGIGAAWFERFSSDFFPRDFAIVDGRKVKVPRYYEKLYRRRSPEARGELDEIKAQRELKAAQRAADNTDARLAVKEVCHQARVNRWRKGGL